jgi:hypothetical protein
MRKTVLFLIFSVAAWSQTGTAPAKQQDDQPSPTAKPKTKDRAKKAPATTRQQQNPAEPNAAPVEPHTPIEPSAPRTPVSPDNPTKPADPTKPTTTNPPASK